MDFRRVNRRTPLALAAIAALGVAAVSIGLLAGQSDPLTPATPVPSATPTATPTPTETPDADGFLPSERETLDAYAAAVGWHLTDACAKPPAGGENDVCLLKPKRDGRDVVVEVQAPPPGKTYTLVLRQGSDGQPQVVSAVVDPSDQKQQCPVHQLACAFGERAALLATNNDAARLMADWPPAQYTCPGTAPLCDGASPGEQRGGFEAWEDDTERVLNAPDARQWLQGVLARGGEGGWRLASIACGSDFPEPATCATSFALTLVGGDAGPMLILAADAGPYGLASKITSAHLLDPSRLEALGGTIYPSPPGTIFDRFRTFRPAASSFDGQLYPVGVDTGVPIVNRAARAMQVPDRAAFPDLVKFTPIPCQDDRTGPVSAPLCGDLPKNAVNPVLPLGFCGESDYARPEDFDAMVDQLTSGNPRLYAVTELPAIPEIGLYPSGRYAAFFGVDDGPNPPRGIVVYLDEAGIVGVDFGCAGGPDAPFAANPNKVWLAPKN